MSRCLNQIRHLLPVLIVALSLTAWGQDASSSGQAQDSGAPPAATGPSEQNLENPPLSGLDKPRAEPAFGGRSYLVPGLQISEGVDSNPTEATNGSADTVTRVLGSVDLQKLWRKYQVGLDYVGGEAAYTGPVPAGVDRFYQVHTLASDQRIPWRTGQIAVRDTFDYLPQGTFGFDSYGGVGSFTSSLGLGTTGTGLGGGIAGGIPGGLFGGGQFGSFGFEPRIENLSVIDVAQELSTRATVTLGGGYDFTNFLSSGSSNKGIHPINSEQATGQVGYNRILSHKDQVGVLYAFQEFHFPTAGSGTIEIHVWNGLYGHRVTGKLNFVVGGGPEVVVIRTPPFSFFLLGIFPITIPGSTKTSVSATANVALDYTWSARTTFSLAFMRYTTAGSGFFAGANTDAVRVSGSHGFARKWTASADVGYSYNSRLQNLPSSPTTTAASYQYWYLGASMRRQLGPHFDAFATYQFNEFAAGSCGTSGTLCGRHQQYIAVLGLNWHPRPIRLD